MNTATNDLMKSFMYTSKQTFKGSYLPITYDTISATYNWNSNW